MDVFAAMSDRQSARAYLPKRLRVLILKTFSNMPARRRRQLMYNPGNM